MTNPALFCRTFVARGKEILASHPTLQHTWSIDDDDDHCILDIPETVPEGFPVTIEVGAGEMVVFGQGFHQHFEWGEDPVKTINTVFGLVRDLLSPGMRVREFLAGGWAYRWDLESLRDGEWKAESTTGLFFWNYFGKRSQRFYQNHLLEGRPE